jgi:hypothetical protein
VAGLALATLALAGCGGGSAAAPQSSVASPSTSSSSASAPTTTVKSGTGTAQISWTPPTTTTDGSTLLNLAGYDIYYGTNPSALTQEVQVSNIGLTTYDVTGLGTGTWYFVVTSYTTDGTQSAPSNVVSHTIS